MFETLVDHISRDQAQIVPRLEAYLNSKMPKVIAVPGWAPIYSQTAIRWAGKNNARVVVMTDSNIFDAKRYYPLEQLKRSILKCTSAALTSGQSAGDYVRKLGVSEQRIVPGLNCIDNDHFDAPSPSAAEASPRYFLSVGRLVEKKNYSLLLSAYSIYLERARTASAWNLKLVGDGEDKQRLMDHAMENGIDDKVEFAGFCQYDALPSKYAAASAFILPSRTEQWGLVVNEAMAAGLPVIVSSACGCCPELVSHGHNGYIFDSDDVNDLADRMLDIASNETRRQAFAKQSKQIISSWSPDRFAAGLKESSLRAREAPAPRPSLVDRLLCSLAFSYRYWQRSRSKAPTRSSEVHDA